MQCVGNLVELYIPLKKLKTTLLVLLVKLRCTRIINLLSCKRIMSEKFIGKNYQFTIDSLLNN